MKKTGAGVSYACHKLTNNALERMINKTGTCFAGDTVIFAVNMKLGKRLA
ncbi:hypothetical protein ABC498_004863 [Salmonella enterica]|nr:hypothetical protein [Salmonella enterica subsp. enterica serovar Adelaide]EHK3592829.1 hypothetical protein [Salmonella enterica]EIK9524410.1 hypothetical protein [Salmonella enterica]ELM9326885.1 hypothetical protein [Salmonella enterica]